MTLRRPLCFFSVGVVALLETLPPPPPEEDPEEDPELLPVSTAGAEV